MNKDVCNSSKSQNLNFVYNDNQYYGSFILSDGKKSLSLSQNMIMEFNWDDAVYSIDHIGARGFITLNTPEDFLEKSAPLDSGDTVSTQERQQMLRQMYLPPLMPDGSFGAWTLTPNQLEETPHLVLESGNSDNILLRVDLHPVDEKGEIFAAKYPDKNMWIYSILFSVNEIKDNGEKQENKKHTLLLTEKTIYDLQKNTGVKYTTPGKNNGAWFTMTEKTGIAMRALLQEYQQTLNSQLPLTDQMLIDDGTAYTTLGSMPSSSFFDKIKICFNNHQSNVDQTNTDLPLWNFMKMEKQNKDYQYPVVPPDYMQFSSSSPAPHQYTPRKISVRSMKHYFDEEKVFIAPSTVTRLNEESPTGRYMLETLFLQGGTDCNNTHTHEEGKESFGITHNLMPGLHSIIYDYTHSLGSSVLNDFLTNYTCFESENDGNDCVYTLTCKDYFQLYKNMMMQCFGSNVDTVFRCDSSDKKHENHVGYIRDVWWNSPAELDELAYGISVPQENIPLTFSKLVSPDELNRVSEPSIYIGIKGLMEAGKQVQQAYLFGADTLEFEVDGLTLREPGRFLKVERVGADQDSHKDKKILGYWFVTNIQNIFQGERFRQKLTCIKPYKIAEQTPNVASQPGALIGGMKPLIL